MARLQFRGEVLCTGVPILACTSIYTLENTPNLNEWGNKKLRTTGFTSVDFWKESK